MDTSMISDREIAELIVTVKNIEKDIAELKSTVKGDYQTKEGMGSMCKELEDVKEDVLEIKGNLSKVVWLVLSTVITAGLYLIINGMK